MFKAKKKYFFRKPFKLMTRKEIDYLLNKDVFSQSDFKRHVQETSQKTGIDAEIVERVIKNYITNVMIILNTIQKIKTKINIHGFFSFLVEKGNRI